MERLRYPRAVLSHNSTQAISAVDLAIWDALGKLRNEPVYMLLGGKTKNRLPVYSTTARPDLAKELGFIGAKFPLPYGPGDGDEGMAKNIAEVCVCHQWGREEL